MHLVGNISIRISAISLFFFYSHAFFFFFYGSIYFPYNIPFKYSEDFRFFRGFCPDCCLQWLLLQCRGPARVVGIATGYGLEGPGIESRCGRDFPHLSRPALGPTQPPAQWVPGLSRGIKSGRGVTLTPHPLLVPWSWKGRAIPLLPLWAVRPVQGLSASTRVHFTLLFTAMSKRRGSIGPLRPTIVKVRNEWSYISIKPCALISYKTATSLPSIYSNELLSVLFVLPIQAPPPEPYYSLFYLPHKDSIPFL